MAIFCTNNTLVLIFNCLCFSSMLLLSGTVQAAENLSADKPPIQLHYDNQTQVKSSPSEMSDGLIEIKHIRLQGDTLFPEYGITNEFLHERVNQVYSHMNQKLSISDINKIADALTLAYREKGLTFNQAYVVPQEITQSTLTIHVLKGTLAEVDIYNNSLYSTGQLTAPFENLIGKVIYEPEIKKVVATLNQKPGLKIFSFFSIGSKQGEARLNVRVMEETQHHSTLTVDNKGVDQTGVNRILFSHIINNPFNLSGQLRGTALATNKQGNFFGSLGYTTPITPANQLSFSILRSDFAVTGQFTDLGLEGNLSAATAIWSNQPENNKTSDIAHNRWISISTKQSNVTSDEFSDFLNEEVDYTMLSGTYQIHFLGTRQSKSQHIFSLSPSYSNISATDNTALPSDFWLVNASYKFMTPEWSKIIPLHHPFSISAKGQFTSEQLPSSEQLATTGANANRGFEPGIFSADSAYTFSLEQAIIWSIDVAEQPNQFTLQPFLFFDYSYGELNTNTDFSAKFQSAGVGLKASYNKLANAGVTVGHPLDHNVSSQLNIDQKQAVIYAHLSLSF